MLKEKELITQQLKLRFFDLDINIKSDSTNFINLFAQMYHRFQKNGTPLAAQPSIDFIIIANPDNFWGKPVMIFDGKVWPVSNSEFLEGYAYESILSTLVTRVRSHLLVHAGAVSRRGQGIIIAADTRHGKTTLVLELVRRGFKFLSDEMAALGRVDRLVHPFPRSLWIRRGTLELAGFPDVVDRATNWMDKLLLDIEEIRPGSLGEAASIDQIIVLKDPTEVQRGIQENLVSEVCVTVDRLDDVLIDEISQNDGATGVQVDADGKYPTLRFRTAQSSLILSHIEKLCRRQKILVLDVTKGERGRPSFEGHARLEDIPKSQAAMELLGRFQGGYMSELLHDEFGGNSARLFMELSTFVGQAQCYKLFVGPLHEMADLVCDIAGT